MAIKVLMISRPSLFSVPGGDTTQLNETAEALRKLGVSVDYKGSDQLIDYSSYDLLHFFNIIRPNAINYHVQKARLPFLISTIFVDYSEIESKHRPWPFVMLYKLLGADGMEYLKMVARAIKNGESILDYSYLLKGHRKSVEKLLNAAAMLLPNSESEFLRLQKRYHFSNQYKVIPNAVNDVFFERADQLESDIERKGLVCVARIEKIKNQLNLIRAVNQTDFQLKLIGKAAPNHLGYFEQCKKEAGSNIHFLGQKDRAEVISEMRSAKLHILPSYFETTGLSSLEAAASGCQVVVSPRGDTTEYFKDLAFYCEPDEPNSILQAIEKAMNCENDGQLKNFVSENYRWGITAKRTKEAYQMVLNSNEK